jgi:hypothetical protein
VHALFQAIAEDMLGSTDAGSPQHASPIRLQHEFKLPGSGTPPSSPAVSPGSMSTPAAPLERRQRPSSCC